MTTIQEIPVAVELRRTSIADSAISLLCVMADRIKADACDPWCKADVMVERARQSIDLAASILNRGAK